MRDWVDNLFTGRSHGDIQEPAQFFFSIPSTTLGDVGRDRGARPAGLTSETVPFLLWKPRGHSVDRERQAVRPLLDFQVSKVTHFI